MENVREVTTAPWLDKSQNWETFDRHNAELQIADLVIGNN